MQPTRSIDMSHGVRHGAVHNTVSLLHDIMNVSMMNAENMAGKSCRHPQIVHARVSVTVFVRVYLIHVHVKCVRVHMAHAQM